MSVSKAQIRDFANYVGSHPALAEFEKRVDAKIWDEFKSADTEAKRVQVGYLNDAFTIILQEIHSVVAEMRLEKQTNEEKE